MIGTVSHDTTFFHVGLSDFPAKEAKIEYSIRFKEMRAPPVLRIHTSEDEVDIKKRCISSAFGQVFNKNLRVTLSSNLRSRYTTRSQRNGVFSGRAKIKIFDYIERNFSFSLGFQCEVLSLFDLSLVGVEYNFNLYDQTNDIHCTPMPHYTGLLKNCSKFYSQISAHNLMGDLGFGHQHPGLDEDNWGKILLFDSLARQTSWNGQNLIYQYAEELLCYLFIPECGPKQNVVQACRELCYDAQYAYREIEYYNPEKWRTVKKLLNNLSWVNKLEDLVNCTYLPSLNGNIPCFYKPVVCGPPPNVTNATVSHKGDKFPATSKVKYSCVSDLLTMKGNSTVRCLYSGKWSSPPVCSLDSSSNTVAILVSVPIVLVVTILIAIFIWFKCWRNKRQKDETLSFGPRNAEFDTFLCYNFNMDHKYVMETLLPELDEEFINQRNEGDLHRSQVANDNPDENAEIPQIADETQTGQGFKIFIESLHFIPGRLICENIENAIKKSNSAIVLVSQGFVNSPWCRKEFELCKLENMNNSAFKIFVIMMQPENELENVNDDMKRFFETTTFLKKDDPDLMNKLSHHLAGLRSIHGSPA